MTPSIGETWIIERIDNGKRRVGRLTKIEGAKKPGWLHIGFDSWLLADQWKPVRWIDLEDGVAA